MRPLNAFLAALGVLAGMALSVGPVPEPACQLQPPLACSHVDRVFPPLYVSGSAALAAAFFITAFGNVLNDLRDVDVDRIAHPSRPLPSGTVTKRSAARMLGLLLSLGLAFAALAGVWPLLFAAGTVLLLLLYESRLKREGLSGNLVVALLTASTFLFGAVAQGHLETARFAVIAAAMAFFVNLAREVAKDMQDVDADRGHRRTLPMQLGMRKSGFVVAAAALAGIVASAPFMAWHQDCLSRQDFLVLTGLLLAADAAVASGGLLSFSRPAWAQRLLKVGMAVALVAFFFVPLFVPPGLTAC